LFKTTFKKCLPVTILSGFCVIVTTNLIFKNAFTQAHGAVATSSVAGTVLTSLAFNLISMLIMCCVILQIKRVVDKGNTSLSSVLKRGLVRGIISIFSLLLFIIVYYIAVFIVYLVLHFIPVIGSTIAIIIIALASVYLLITIFAWLPLMVDGMSPIKALKKSFDLVKNNWWRTFLLVLFVGVAVMIVEFIIMSISGVSIRAASSGMVPSIPVVSLVLVFLVALVFPTWLWGVIWLQIKDLE
jgi:hypothetical protein